jgi:uracil-DNA glycosylase
LLKISESALVWRAEVTGAEKTQDLPKLLAEIRACKACAADLPLGPRPIVRGEASARLLIVS